MGSVRRTFILRQMLRPRKQSVLFVCCVSLSLVTLVALGGFDLSVKASVWRDARTLLGGDLTARSRMPFSTPLEEAIRRLSERPETTVARTWEFYSMARNEADSESLFSAIKVVEPAYPLYGELVLQSGETLAERLVPGAAVVAPDVLTRLGIAPGDAIRVGDARLEVTDTVLREPDRPVDVLSFGPRIFVGAADLERLNLLGKGSRIRYTARIRVPDEGALASARTALEAAATDREERIETYRTAESRLQRFIDNFLFFLTLIGVFTLLLAGIGIQASLSAYFRDLEKSIAVMKAMGATRRGLRGQFLWIVFWLGLVGSVVGIAGGLLLQMAMPRLFGGLLPPDLAFSVPWWALAEGLALGLLLTGLFALLPLERLSAVKPSVVLRKELPPPRRTPGQLAVAGAIAAMVAGFLLWRTQDLKTAGILLGGGVAAIAAVTAMTLGLLQAVKRVPTGRLSLRQALRGLFRPRNATASIVVTLTASLSLTASIYLVEKNLEAAFLQSFPDDAPNVFLIDIQPDQKAAVSEMVGPDAILHPNIRSRLISINGVPIDPRQERRRRSDNLARPFNLTYRSFLLADERLEKGRSLFSPDLGDRQVSVLDTIADIAGIRVGDRLRFRIQGVPLEAAVSSIRSRSAEGLSPFFYFVFPETLLAKAPQTLFTGLHLPREEVAGFQSAIVGRFPNISVIDVSQTLEAFSVVLKRMAAIVRFFAGFGVAAGILLIVSSIVATRGARVREAVFFKVLGAKKAFVTRVFFLEYAVIGAISALQSLVVAETVAWFVCAYRLSIPYRPHFFFGGVLAGTTLLLVTGVGLLASRSILDQKPMKALKAQIQE